MQLNLQHSLKSHLESKLGMPVVWIFDGVELPNVKPFITIEQMQNNNDVLTKQQEAIETVFRFQIGFHADTASNRARGQEVMRRSFFGKKIPLLDAESGEQLGFFSAVITSEVPLGTDDPSDKTKYHRVYFDVEITRTFNY